MTPTTMTLALNRVTVLRVVFMAFLFLGLAPLSAQTASTYYVSPMGSDTNPGSAAAPFKSLVKGVSAAKAGDTVSLLPGLYRLGNEPRLSSGYWFMESKLGTDAAPIKVAGTGKDQAIFTGSIPQFENPNSEWVVVDATRNIYRTKNPIASYYPGSALSRVKFVGLDEDGYALIPYQDYADFSSDNQLYYEDVTVPLYVGPGVIYNPLGDGCLYVRLQPPDNIAVFGVTPRATNPNSRSLRIFALEDALYLKDLAYVQFENFAIENFGGVKVLGDVAPCHQGSGQRVTISNQGINNVMEQGGLVYV